ncbi:DUF397 domain-containing protein [Glycomyces salinus]|uniref:DUF397 domain-containing protein n=1 Tax=Glycomyces salinus TaxID=980294 RepID=UPI0018EAE0B5|nr:DUF397 domain-containing protein [Glycomyces salinus]
MKSEWRKSSRSSSQANGDCVEVRLNGDRFEVRDTKLGAESPILDVSPAEWVALLSHEGR